MHRQSNPTLMHEEEETLNKAQLLLELQALRQKLSDFEQEKNDLLISLELVTDHGDLIESEILHRLTSFNKKLVELKQEKEDLVISLETVTDHADVFERELLTARSILEREVIKRTQELEEKNRILNIEIQERKRIAEDLRLAASVYQASNEAIIITDAGSNIINANPAFTRLTGYTPEEVIGRNPSILKSGRHEHLFFQNMWEALLAVGYWSGEIWNRRKTKEIFSGWVSISAVKDVCGKVTHYIGIFTDNTNQKRTEERLYHLAHYDALTDFPNRSLFQERIEQAIKRAARENHWVVLLLIDLDRFKAINDSFGHKAGDELLIVVSQRLLDCLKGDKDALARFGGDEFAIMLADLPAKAALQTASDMSEEVLRRVQEVCPLQDQEIFITASVGIAFFPQDGMNASELFKNADAAMYKAKELGRNGTQFYAPAMNLAVHKRLTLQNSLRRALEREELQLLYQPQLSVADRRIIGVEALLRWSHPTLGPVSPSEFIPLAEDCGLIAPIGEWVLHTACTQNQAWIDAGARPVRMAVNLSVRQFYNENLQPMLLRILQSTGLAPSLLELEITESVAMSCAGNTVCTLQNLKQIGLNLAIDDFGTGYSSLNYLKQFTIDTLKIDASFVRDINSRSGAALIQAMIQMAHSLSMSIVAEGVETEQQFAFLEANGCDIVQGFLFYKPMPASEVMKLLLPTHQQLH